MPSFTSADEGIRVGDWVVVGTARLDTRPTGASDLAFIAESIATRGERCIRDFLGDFAFVATNTVTHESIAARDTFGVRSIYYRETPSGVRFSSHASRLADTTQYDLDYIAEFILSGFDRDNRTPYHGVRAIPPGHYLVAQPGKS